MNQTRGLRFVGTRAGLLVVALLMPLLSVGTELLRAPATEAAACTGPAIAFGRGNYCGYFDNNKSLFGSDVFIGGIGGWVGDGIGNDTQEFIDFINSKRLFGNAQDQTGARFIISTMLGYGGGTPRGQADIDFGVWAASVGQLGATPGRINWHYAAPFPCGIVNTYYQDTYNDDGFFLENPTAGDGCGPFATKDSIAFWDGAGNAYLIKRDCANPIGAMRPIQRANYNLTASVQPGSDAPPVGGIVEPGKIYHLSSAVVNNMVGGSAVPTNGFSVDINNYNPAEVLNAGITWRPAATNGGYWAGGCMSGTSQCWYFNYAGGIGPGAIDTQPDGIAFSISPGAVEGHQACFSATVWPSTVDPNPLVNYTSPQICFSIYKQHYPGVIGTSGDIHVGGKLCGQPDPVSGSAAQLNSASQSLTEYVMSASGSVSGLNSNNGAGGGGTATLGNAGGVLGNYYAICRPDLVSVARAYSNTSPLFTGLGSGSYDLASLPPSATGIYIHNAPGNISLHGTFNRKITIVSLLGDIIIDNPIILNAPSLTGTSAPSLGIISANDIHIDGAATRVDAYLFSDGTIDTCSQGAVAACLNTLTVNGFMMGKGISFRRLGPPTGATNTVGELVNLTGQIYLNPPKFFDNTPALNLIQNQGEKPPLN